MRRRCIAVELHIAVVFKILRQASRPGGKLNISMFFKCCACTVFGFILLEIGIAAEVSGGFSLNATAFHLGSVLVQYFGYSAILLAIMYAGSYVFIGVPDRPKIRRMTSWSLLIVCVIVAALNIPLIAKAYYYSTLHESVGPLAWPRLGYSLIYMFSAVCIYFGLESSWSFHPEIAVKEEQKRVSQLSQK